jgi:hypothetical protein
VLDPLIATVVLFAALCVPVWLASSAHPRPARRPRHGIDHGATAEIEENDIGQMIEGINERRRRNGRAEIGDQLAEELLRSARSPRPER